jgi:hypothetical protein
MAEGSRKPTTWQGLRKMGIKDSEMKNVAKAFGISLPKGWNTKAGTSTKATTGKSRSRSEGAKAKVPSTAGKASAKKTVAQAKAAMAKAKTKKPVSAAAAPRPKASVKSKEKASTATKTTTKTRDPKVYKQTTTKTPGGRVMFKKVEGPRRTARKPKTTVKRELIGGAGYGGSYGGDIAPTRKAKGGKRGQRGGRFHFSRR